MAAVTAARASYCAAEAVARAMTSARTMMAMASATADASNEADTVKAARWTMLAVLVALSAPTPKPIKPVRIALPPPMAATMAG